MAEGSSGASNEGRKKSASWKRLIVLCDGTWQNSTADDPTTFPTNVTRFSRALSPYALVRDASGAYGLGVSANVRAAFGFLAHNYDPEPGDEIFFFGFSRGAYTARSISGLVNNLGLLTKRGMDYFPDVYDEYYKDPANNSNFTFSPALLKKLGDAQVRVTKAQHAVKVVGVWDTVGFHAEGSGGEKIEFHNVELSRKVGHAYHALALDERRFEFMPTLWKWPKDYIAAPDGSGLQDMRQVWFSGAHSDIGGGLYDPHLSNITLAWMIAQCSEDGKLAFVDEEPRNLANQDEYYLLPPNSLAASSLWDTARGQTSEKASEGLINVVKNKLINWFWGVGAADRQPLQMQDTRERIHRSIQNRDLAGWPCGVLAGKQTGLDWPLKRPGSGGDSLREAEANALADRIEEQYRGRIRPAPGQKSDN